MTAENEKAQLATMTSREAVAYWNVLQFGDRMLRVGDDGGKHERHMNLMDELLNERGVPHTRGKRTSWVDGHPKHIAAVDIVASRTQVFVQGYWKVGN
jgi:hypothetical protein